MMLKFKYKKTIILGAGGFIGINLAQDLIAEGLEVICFDRVASPYWPKEVRSIIGEFANMPAELLSELNHAVVFHLISSSRPSLSIENAADQVVYDVVNTIRYLEATKSCELRWVFVSSGGTVYGNVEKTPIDEKVHTNPICSYGIIKLSIEQYFYLFHKVHNTDYVIARLANPYGPWQRPLLGQGAIATLIYKGMKNEKIEIWGDGENIRDYIYIKDAVEGLIAVACAQSGEVYNVGTGIGTSINELINIMSTTLKLSLNPYYTNARLIDVKKNVLFTNKLSLLTGWQARTPLLDGIVCTSKWINEQYTNTHILNDRVIT